MRIKTRRTLAAALALTLAVSAAAVAAGPLKGKTYEGSAPSSGIANYHHLRMRLRSGGNIVLRVARNGRSVTVGFSSSTPLMYCNTRESLRGQTTKPAPISSSGAFRASIGQRFLPGPGAPAIVQRITGRFSGRSVSGTISTSAGECGGTTTFSARAR
jgi:hypothetical protein